MKKSLALLVIVTLILSSCGAKKPEETKIEKDLKEVNILNIKNSPITEEIKLIWKVAWDKETTISSQISWLINKVDVKAWDNVKKDQILATIDTNSQVWVGFNNANIALNNSNSIYGFTTESIQKDIELAKLQLETAKTNKDNVYALADKQLNIAERQKENIKSTQTNTDVSNKETLKNAELGVELATKAYNTSNINIDNFNKNKEETLKSILNKKISLLRNIVSSIQSSYISIDASLWVTDTLLWITDKNNPYSDNIKSYIWAKNASQKVETENKIKELLDLYNKNISYIKTINDKLETDIKNNNITLDSDISSYSKDLGDTLKNISDVKEMLLDLTEVLSNSIPSISFPQTSIDWQKSLILSKQSSLIQSESTLISIKNSLEDINNLISSTKTSLETQEISLKNAIDLSSTQVLSAKQSLTSLNATVWLATSNLDWNVKLTDDQLQNTLSTIKNSKDQADNALKLAQSQLDSSVAKLNSQLVQTKASLDLSKWQKDLAWVSLNNSIIRAPFDSTIVSKNIELWTLVGPSTPLFTVASSDKLKIKLDITGENVSYIKEWDSIRLEFTNWQTSTWIISLASKNANPQTNLFPIEINFDNSQMNSKLWDFVNVYIDKKLWDKNWIMVPFESILNPSDWVYTVFVLSWSIVNSREVKLWLKNSREVEITSWLKEGEKVVTNKVADLENLEEVKVIR